MKNGENSWFYWCGEWMMKASGGFGSRWMTGQINNIVIEGCI